MSHALHRRVVTAAVTASTLALVAVPAADAATKISKTDKAQNTAIKKVSKTAKKAGSDAKKAGQAATKGIADAKAAAGKADSAQGGVNAVLSQVPAVLDGLTKLAAGLTSAGEGLTKIGNALAAQEYGVVKVQVGGVDQPGAILDSADIPDDSNAAIVTGTMLVTIPAGATNTPITLLAGVRSGESDGTGAADPVASAGIVTMLVTSPAGLPLGGGNAPPLAAVPITAAPNAAAGGAPVYPIPSKAPRVDATPNPFSLPSQFAIDLTDPSRLQNLGPGVGPYTVSNPTANAAPVVVTVTVRFNDLTASAADVTA
ncbi:MAG: hypothetical protein QOK49_4281 [Baekduia sp.]|nr:hypothetical protein [Baekduia sp.]